MSCHWRCQAEKKQCFVSFISFPGGPTGGLTGWRGTPLRRRQQLDCPASPRIRNRAGDLQIAPAQRAETPQAYILASKSSGS